jgi:hypothetical protein
MTCGGNGGSGGDFPPQTSVPPYYLQRIPPLIFRKKGILKGLSTDFL